MWRSCYLAEDLDDVDFPVTLRVSAWVVRDLLNTRVSCRSIRDGDGTLSWIDPIVRSPVATKVRTKDDAVVCKV